MSLRGQTSALAQPTASAKGSQKTFTFQELFGPGQTVAAGGILPSILRWRADGVHYLQRAVDAKTRDLQILSVEARTGTSEPLFSAGSITRALRAAGASRAEATGSLDASSDRLDTTETRLLVSAEKDLWVYNRTTGKAMRLTKTPEIAEEEPAFSPDGRWVGFVRDNNLFVVAADAGTGERALTRDGSPLLLNGKLDWVYEEEIYGRGNTNGYSWSPDSRQIAFLRTDDSPIKPFSIIDPVPRQQALQEQRYPLPGDPNPVVKLGIADVADPKTPTRFVDRGPKQRKNDPAVSGNDPCLGGTHRTAVLAEGRNLSLAERPDRMASPLPLQC
jgi:dipeptidyl-peptidase-4